jgi:serine/threonine protein kinase
MVLFSHGADETLPAAAMADVRAGLSRNHAMNLGQPSAPSVTEITTPDDIMEFLKTHIRRTNADLMFAADAVTMIEPLGRSGAMGTVLKCSFRSTPHAVKRMNLTSLLMETPGIAPFFARVILGEVRAMARLRHDRLAHLAAVCLVPADTVVAEPGQSPQPLDDSEVWLVLPLAEGGDLRQAMPRIRGDVPLCLRLLAQVADALVFMHAEGIAHMDIKPDNILLNDLHTEAKIADLGLSQEAPGTGRATIPTVVRGGGTVGYAPREQMDQHSLEPITVSADVFAFAVMTFELLVHQSATWVNTAATEGHVSSIVSALPAIAQALGPVLALCLTQPPRSRPRMSDVRDLVHATFIKARAAAGAAPAAAAADIAAAAVDPPVDVAQVASETE